MWKFKIFNNPSIIGLPTGTCCRNLAGFQLKKSKSDELRPFFPPKSFVCAISYFSGQKHVKICAQKQPLSWRYLRKAIKSHPWEHQHTTHLSVIKKDKQYNSWDGDAELLEHHPSEETQVFRTYHRMNLWISGSCHKAIAYRSSCWDLPPNSVANPAMNLHLLEKVAHWWNIRTKPPLDQPQNWCWNLCISMLWSLIFIFPVAFWQGKKPIKQMDLWPVLELVRRVCTQEEAPPPYEVGQWSRCGEYGNLHEFALVMFPHNWYQMPSL